jgi:hypothetical protein
MATLVVYPETAEQEQAVKAALEALHINFEEEIDETDYITSSPAMMERLAQSHEDIKAGKGQKVDIKNLWK